MNELATKKRDLADNHIDFTPMIDCMFLLMMFNMIAYTLSGPSDVTLPSSKHAQGNNAQDATVVVVIQSKERPSEVTYHLNNGGTPPVSVEDVRKAMTEGAKTGRTKLVIKAEPKVQHRHVAELAILAGGIENGSVLIAVQSER